MINSSEAKIKQVIAHYVGNPLSGDVLRISEGPLNNHNDKLNELLKTYFLSHFTTPSFYAFTSPNKNFNLNPLFNFALAIFYHPELLYENSVAIANHLFEVTKHPNIKSGELFITYITDIEIEGKRMDAVGIFKSEVKESYLKLINQPTQIDITNDEGINVKRLDKGCLILNDCQDQGFRILMVDNVNKTDAHFWKDDFLNVEEYDDSFHHTSTFMNLTRQYVADQIPEEFSVSKADQIDLLNRSMNFFKSKDQFSKATFEQEVLGDADVIESFRNYGKNYMEDFNANDNFEISAHAVKKQARVFKSVLKLDSNFHIYIHGSRELIEKGFDEATGKHYYKIYFDSES